MPICTRCTTNTFLRSWIEARGAVTPCSLCGTQTEVAADSAQFLRYVDSVIRRHYTPVDPAEDGEPAGPLIARLAGISAELARRVMEVRHPEEPIGGTFYDYGPLSFGGRWSRERSERWERLKQVVKHQARFFGAETRTTLDTILGRMEEFCGGAAIRTLAPTELVFRARLARSYQEADAWFKTPDVSLHAPPAEKATAGRMNAAGVRVFYGALEERIAVAEIRPPIGSHVVVGAFAPTRPLRILDLGALGGVFDYADLFSPEFDATSTRLTFLQTLEQEISLPVQPHDEVLEYIPTQVITEYVRIVLGLDGLAYRSAQVSETSDTGQITGPRLPPGKRNVVLLGPSAVTAAEPPPEGAEPGLRFAADSAKLLDIRRIEITYEPNMWAHYVDAPVDEE